MNFLSILSVWCAIIVLAQSAPINVNDPFFVATRESTHLDARGAARMALLDDIKHCSARDGCDCDCSWANPSTCGGDDGSCCWGCCCGSAPPSPPSPSPPSPPSTLSEYCPSADDLTIAYSDKTSPQIVDQGWTIHGGGGVASKSAFNLIGGYVEYDIDFSGVPTGVNANIYSISPSDIGSGIYTQSKYCDGAGSGAPWCVEVDWIESNGNCGGATTLHTKQGPGNEGCTAWGCRESYHYGGRAAFHMRVEFAADGAWTTIRDGQVIAPASLSPAPGAADQDTMRAAYASAGAVVYSSQWTGWVPVDDCGTTGDLSSAVFKVSNLKIVGAVTQGPTPRKCS